MSSIKSYGYDSNVKKYDVERFKNEIKASPLPPLANTKLVNPSVYNGHIWVAFETSLDLTEEGILNQIALDHDGTLKSRTSYELQTKRESVLSELVDLAHNHPVLKNMPDEITSYLTSIDNWFNAWKRDGNHTQLVAKIIDDANNISHPNNALLNEIVDAEGAKTFEFIISYIPTTPYI